MNLVMNLLRYIGIIIYYLPLEHISNKRLERRHHISTDHGPMVQGGLLTAHPGSVHGDGEAPGDESSLRQGAGTGFPGNPDLEMAAVVKQRRDHRKGFCPGGFRVMR